MRLQREAREAYARNEAKSSIADCGFRKARGLSPWARAGWLYKQTQFPGGTATGYRPDPADRRGRIIIRPPRRHGYNISENPGMR